MTLSSLIARVEGLTRYDNDLDVLVEIALFEPDDIDASIRANNAGTKVIYTQHDGKERTYLSGDWTFSEQSRRECVAALRARDRISTVPATNRKGEGL